MLCNQAGIDLIKEFEGCKLNSYQDQAGIWTIGYGTTGPFVTPNMTIEQATADAWLINHIDTVAAALTRMIKTPINENQFAALVSLAYNIGVGAFSNSSALGVLNEGYIDQVPAKMMLWDKITVGGQHIVDAGLVRRRQAEVNLYNTPVSSGVTTNV